MNKATEDKIDLALAQALIAMKALIAACSDNVIIDSRLNIATPDDIAKGIATRMVMGKTKVLRVTYQESLMLLENVDAHLAAVEDYLLSITDLVGELAVYNLEKQLSLVVEKFYDHYVENITMQHETMRFNAEEHWSRRSKILEFKRV